MVQRIRSALLAGLMTLAVIAGICVVCNVQTTYAGGPRLGGGGLPAATSTAPAATPTAGGITPTVPSGGVTPSVPGGGVTPTVPSGGATNPTSSTAPTVGKG
jgi:hypothetical protein